ncbi:hydantoinase/oxoprolinase family protein [Roseovarius indicus]|uniref:Acetophenone carboxylase gamma subunit n=1 Tax=Roseovarius indicus TaxID=540747 RepID=A0A0T5PFP7_9RHOB|nr:hydantoinase/oxoprolinase family protein [Roseovarius indicus]KRS19780.1 hydantoinase [Roseovarius indicus]QEW28861.1 Acetophenone carboxylase gamma subunit [Roseovarius indicus]SFD83388.1 N-methylhydantoinase A [Roseovarius indicus]
MGQERSGLVAGVDVGGTFTDLLQLDQTTGAVRIAKVPSTPENQAFGVMNALTEADCELAALDLIVHGTTTTTNAVLERKLSRTGLITTQGFRDVLELGRRTRPQAYGMTGQFTPLIPRDLRLEVPERTDAAGQIVTPLDEDALRTAAQTLLDAGCEAVVVHFLHAYANPAHEQRAGAVLAEIWPNSHITLGHAILQESREFERGVTAAVNASVQPILDRYLRRLTESLAKGGYDRDVLVMNGNGGMVSSRFVAQEAAKTVMSGPASGVMAAAYTGRIAGMPDLLTYDMGGTSTDVALVRNAEPAVSNEIEIEYAMPIHVPMVDVRTVGAGGGSIARVNAAGLLEVGPQSAGADPGPICYGRGGTEPTISDANLLLGRLDPGRLAVKGGVTLQTVEEIFAERLGRPLGLTAHEAAQAVVQLANTTMAGAIRMVSLSLGADPRDFALFAFGGAGPLHAASLARELGVPRVLVPSRPGITNAIGCVVADLRHDFVQTINTPVDALADTQLADIFAAQKAEGERLIAKERVEIRGLRHLYSVDMQFVGQTHLLRVDLETPEIDNASLRELFEIAYFRRFRVELSEIRANVVNANCSVIGARVPLDLSTLIDPSGRKPTLSDAQTGTRKVRFGSDIHDTPIYWRDHLPLDVALDGPAIIQQMDTTLLIEPGDTAKGDEHGNIILHVGAPA